jgi:hypothetical protein
MMDQLLGEEGGFRRAAFAFVAELDRVVASIGHDRMAMEELGEFAHKIRGAAALFGAAGTQTTAGVLEMAVRDGADAAALDGAMAKMATAMQADAADLRERLREAAVRAGLANGAATADLILGTAKPPGPKGR